MDDLTHLRVTERVRFSYAWKKPGPLTFEPKISKEEWQQKFDEGVKQYLDYLKHGKAFDFSSFPQTIRKPAITQAAYRLLRQERKKDEVETVAFIENVKSNPYHLWFLLMILLGILSGGKPQVERNHSQEIRGQYGLRES